MRAATIASRLTVGEVRWRMMHLSLVAVAIVAIVLASWLPGDTMVRSGHLSGRTEHVIAYLMLGLICLELRPNGRTPSKWLVGLIVLAVVMELGQFMVPGRSATLGDAMASIVGLLTAATALRVRCAWLNWLKRRDAQMD